MASPNVRAGKSDPTVHSGKGPGYLLITSHRLNSGLRTIEQMIVRLHLAFKKLSMYLGCIISEMVGEHSEVV